MKASQLLTQFRQAHRQTKYFIFMWALYLIALVWTTVQAYARLEYSRSDVVKIRLEEPSSK